MKNSLFFGLLSLLCVLTTQIFAKDFVVKGKVVNEKTAKLIKNAKLRFEDLKKPEKIFYTANVEEDGFSIINMKISSGKEGTAYKLTIEAEGYEPYADTITLYYSKAGLYEIPTLKLNPKSKAGTIKGVVLSKRTGKALANASVTINDTNLKTDETGTYTFSINKIFFFTPLDINVKAELFGYQSMLVKKNFILTLEDSADFIYDPIKLDSDKVQIQFQGKVVDYFGGADTEGAEISIDNNATKTDKEGHYVVKGLKIDYELETAYKVKVIKEGYITNNQEFKVSYINNGVLNMTTIQLHHEPLEAAKFLKPDKTAFSLRPKFEWQLPASQINNIEFVTLSIATDKSYADAQTITLPNATTEVVFPNGELKRLKPETPYFAKVTYTLKRKQESLVTELNFNTAAMQFAVAPIPASPISSGTSTDLYPTWAQDGKTFYYTSNNTDDTQKIFEIFSKRTDRLGQTSKITSSMAKSSDTKPSAGPGNEMVSYLSNRIGVYNIWSIKTGENQNKAPMQLTSFETLPIHWISCAKDGKKIVYCREKLPAKIKRSSSDLEIWMLNVSDGVKTQLDVEGTQVKVSPDGEKILYVSDKQGSPDIWMYDISKGQTTQLVVDPNSIDTDPCWTKDGNSIVYASNKTGNFDLWIMSIREDKKRPLTNSLADERYPDCNPVTNEVIYCSDESEIWKLKKITLPDDQ